MNLSQRESETTQTCNKNVSTGQKRQIKSVTLHRASPDEDWGLRITGNGWQDGEWMSKNNIYSK